MSELYDKMSALDKLVPAEGIAAVFKKKAQAIWEHYLSRQLPPAIMSEDGGSILKGTLEPRWIHYGYELVKKFADGGQLDNDEMNLVDQIITSHSLKDGHSVPAFPGQPKSPMRTIHDGWKAGTPSWIFMGRALTPDSIVHLGADWVAVQRTLPDEFYKDMDKSAAPPTLWMAYNLNEQMGLTALTSNVIGPAVYFNQLWEEVNSNYGPLYKTDANQKYK